MSNLAFDKPATSSSFVAPYAPSRAVDGSTAPFQRWLCNTVPCWLSVDLGNTYWINRWVVGHMPLAGWSAPYYVMSHYKLQGSLDSVNWFDIDSISGNQASMTDRTFPAVQVKFARVVVTRGLNINPQLASMMEFEVYEVPPTSPYLSNLAFSSGTLNPTFNRDHFSYTVNVENDVDSIFLLPIAEDPKATIKVNGIVVPSGQVSEPLALNVGDNTITVAVTSKIGDLTETYTVNVVRAGNAYLSDLVMKGGKKKCSLDPTFSKTTLHYDVAVSYLVKTVTLTPTADDPASATIKVNGTVVNSGAASAAISLNVGANDVNVEVIPQIGDSITYTVTITRANP